MLNLLYEEKLAKFLRKTHALSRTVLKVSDKSVLLTVFFYFKK